MLKGVGSADGSEVRPILFGYIQKAPLNTRRFDGGEMERFSRHAARAALAIRREYRKALKERDPAVLLARNQYGITEPPVLRPIYLLRPLKIPVFSHDLQKITLKNPSILKQARPPVPQEVIDERAVFVYEVPTPTRVKEIDQAERPNFDQWHLNQFAARIALARHLLNRRLRGTFSSGGTSSLFLQNVTTDGVVVDLDTTKMGINDVLEWIKGMDADESYVAWLLKGMNKNAAFIIDPHDSGLFLDKSVEEVKAYREVWKAGAFFDQTAYEISTHLSMAHAHSLGLTVTLTLAASRQLLFAQAA